MKLAWPESHSRSSVGVGTKLNWRVGRGAEGNGGVAAAGHYLRADLESVAAAVDHAEAGFSAGTSPTTLTNPASEKAYPIATFSWLVVPRQGAGSDKRELLIQFLQWALNSGQKQAAALGYVAVPDAIVEEERKVLATLK
jgi:ABC-type phosphate transport system substrate-binding protein